MSEHFIQRVYVLVEAGHPSDPAVMGVLDYETIPDEIHYRSEVGIADALRRLAGRFETYGGGFIGPIGLARKARAEETKEQLLLLRNDREPYA